MAIGIGLPEDGEAVTRRALEATKTCLAIKADAANGGRRAWRRSPINQWKELGRGGIPKPLRLQYGTVQAEPLDQELQTEVGALSDYSVHFTPEYFGRYIWEETPLEHGGFEFSFGLRAGEIELAFMMRGKHHELIMRVLDSLPRRKMLLNSDVNRALGNVYTA